jgi:hypothetical protein
MLRNRSHRGMISGSAVADSAEGRGAPTGTPKGGGLYKESMSVQCTSRDRCGPMQMVPAALHGRRCIRLHVLEAAKRIWSRTCSRHGARHVTQNLVVEPPPAALTPYFGDGLRSVTHCFRWTLQQRLPHRSLVCCRTGTTSPMHSPRAQSDPLRCLVRRKHGRQSSESCAPSAAAFPGSWRRVGGPHLCQPADHLCPKTRPGDGHRA